MEENQRVSSYLAANIEYLRGKKGFSQAQLAKSAGIPRSTLTNMESGEGNPSLSNLVKISASLGVGIEELLSRPRNELHLVPADQVPVVKRASGRVRMRKLLPDKLKGIEIDHVEIDAESIMPGHPHLSGTKEYMTVLRGEIMVHVGGESTIVKKGDVFAFPGNQPHSYRNTKRSTSEMISVVIPVPANV